MLDAHDRDRDALKPKRTRITVEILAKGSHGLSDIIPDNIVPPPARNPRQTATPTVASATTTPATNPPPSTEVAKPAPKQEPTLTKHQSKVINGIKHELDRLQPQAKDTNPQEQGRKLRSQEATRFKSELSAYFPEYDEVIGNEPKEQRTCEKKSHRSPERHLQPRMISNPHQTFSTLIPPSLSSILTHDALFLAPNAQHRSNPTPLTNIPCEDMAMPSSTTCSMRSA